MAALPPSPVLAIIPARLGSTRFPRKMLASATGRPLVQHVREAALRARAVSRVIVATDSEEIAAAVRGFGGEAVMTSAAHPNGTSRLAEAAQLLGLPDDATVVNVQGDEPELDASLIDLAVQTHAESGADIATVASPFGPAQDPADPNLVKVVLDGRGRALYFSRSLIPHDRDRSGACGARPLKHVGLYVYAVGFLRRYVALPETPLECAEKLEQLRALEHGHTIAVAVAESHHVGIDTPAQYDAFVSRHAGA
ncbi:MAG TPA: 3-deoxy-manno-octulosonate cytidylyltransferase [Phycisphaerales bacterium]|nr:3-deoxy-manno-octulosonate cytidylyltransferase [Phycisphaerales bacterium]